MKLIKQIFYTKIGWALISFILMNIFIYLELPNWLVSIPFTYIAGLVLVATFYGIKNMLTDRKRSIK